jgi:hypothetical protein
MPASTSSSSKMGVVTSETDPAVRATGPDLEYGGLRVAQHLP